MKAALPHCLLGFYGDDFTGSTDTMEVAALAGLDPVLFLDTPDASAIERFPDARVVGIAGISRSQAPDWMDRHLPPAFEALKRIGAPFVHYKVCSTFDSARDVGSIGRAAEIGRRVFGERPVPVLVGAPALRRYVAFGNLFAAYRDESYRIDRHPVMSRHPVTPMREADLRRHLAGQTDLSAALVDLPRLDALDPDGDWRAGLADADLVLFDTVDARTLERAGLFAWSMRGDRNAPSFAVGSSGFEYALVAAWRRLGLLPAAPPPPAIRPVERLFAVSGSCSPMTALQIDHALAAGFVGIDLDPRQAVEGSLSAATLAERCLAELNRGRDVLLATARGPETVVEQAVGSPGFNDRLGAVLGRVLREVLERSGLKRAVVAGGDTSSHAVGQLGLEALRFAGPLAPGSPLCRTFGSNPALDGLELALKGGQVGNDDYFVRARNGRG